MKRFMVVVICVWYCRAYLKLLMLPLLKLTGSYCACMVYLYLGCYY